LPNSRRRPSSTSNPSLTTSTQSRRVGLQDTTNTSMEWISKPSRVLWVLSKPPRAKDFPLKTLSLYRTFLKSSLQLKLGPNVSQLEKSEIKVPADHAGLSELLRPCLIVSASPADKLCKLEFQLKTSSLAAESPVVTDAMEGTHQELSISGKTKESSLDGSTKQPTGAILMPLPPATTILMESTDPAEPKNPPLNAANSALVDTPRPILEIKSMLNQFTVFLLKLPKSKLRSWLTDPLRPPSPFTTTSLPTKPVFITTPQAQPSEVMPSKSLDGVLNKELLTGWWPTAGTRDGETMVSSKSEEETTNAELRDKSLLVSPNSDCHRLKIIIYLKYH